MSTVLRVTVEVLLSFHDNGVCIDSTSDKYMAFPYANAAIAPRNRQIAVNLSVVIQRHTRRGVMDAFVLLLHL